jgi:hypothetical protein
MLKQIFATTMVILFSLTAQAKGVTDDDMSAPKSADIVFMIESNSVMYRQDGYMLVCLDKKKVKILSCHYDEARLTLEEFWKWYFPSAPTLRVVAMDYRVNYAASVYVFWLKR